MFLCISGHAATWSQSSPCWTGQHEHAHYRPASCWWHNTAGLHTSRIWPCHLHSARQIFSAQQFLSFVTAMVKLPIIIWQNEACIDLHWNLDSHRFLLFKDKAMASWVSSQIKIKGKSNWNKASYTDRESIPKRRHAEKSFWCTREWWFPLWNALISKTTQGHT